MLYFLVHMDARKECDEGDRQLHKHQRHVHQRIWNTRKEQIQTTVEN
jgi:hypothetical protein